MSETKWWHTWGSIFKRTGCKYYMAIVAYWFHLDPSDYCHHCKLINLYSFCFKYYEEWEFADTKQLKGWGLGVQDRKYQVDFLIFYQFKRPASDSLMMMLNSIQKPTGGVIDRTLLHALEVCIIYYLKEEKPCQFTQDLLCISCLLQGASMAYGGIASDQSIWDTVAMVVKRFPELYLKYFNLVSEKWTFNESQLQRIHEYMWELGKIDMLKEMKKWPIKQMIPKAPQYVLDTMGIPPSEPIKMLPCSWKRACNRCRASLSDIEQSCSIKHSITIFLETRGDKGPRYTHEFNKSFVHPLQCTKGCAVVYTERFNAAKRCGCI